MWVGGCGCGGWVSGWEETLAYLAVVGELGQGRGIHVRVKDHCGCVGVCVCVWVGGWVRGKEEIGRGRDRERKHPPTHTGSSIAPSNRLILLYPPTHPPTHQACSHL